MGERWEINQTTAAGSDELFESTVWLDAHLPGPPPHVHPSSEERIEVVEGSLEVFRGGEWTTLAAGEAAVISAGAPHTFRNSSEAQSKIVIRIAPAGRSEEFFRCMQALIRDGKVKRLPPKDPRSAIYAAMLFDAYPDWTRAIGPVNGVFKAMALIGKALRFEL
jgi:mannose-6-phosphate isomerase-like protein (cupin superfamily)